MARHKYMYKVPVDEAVTKRRHIIKEIIIWILESALVILAAYYISFFWLEKTPVINNSMAPTLNESERVLINKFTYRFKDPERFDIIVYKQSNKEHSYYDIKRIIGLPGETVRIDEAGQIYINGSIYPDIIIADTMNNAGLAGEDITLDEGEYFVLGDNRNESEDSRFANIGNIIGDDIIGTAWIRLKPFAIIKELNLIRE